MIPVLGILIALLIVLVAGSVTVYKFRLDIQVLLFAKYGLRLPGKRSLDAQNQNRTYTMCLIYIVQQQR